MRLLRQAGFEAFGLTAGESTLPPWLQAKAPDLIPTLDRRQCEYGTGDFLVLPEVEAQQLENLDFPGLPIVFVQGSAPLLSRYPPPRGFPAPALTRELQVATILPHLQRLLRRYYDIEASLIPPFIADSFFLPGHELHQVRQKRVVLHVKDLFEEAGFPGKRFLESVWSQQAPQDWELCILEGYTQRQVAELLRTSSVLVNLNQVEAFNTTVPEAMAAGCHVVCYEAVGGQDFLSSTPGSANADVYPTGDIQRLADHLFDLLHSWDSHTTQTRVKGQRERAFRTASGFTDKITGHALVAYFSSLGLNPGKEPGEDPGEPPR